MERTMKVTLISAEDLKRVNLISKMEVYADVWLSSDPAERRRTAADVDNRRNPKWSAATFHFKIPDAVDSGSLLLHVQLRSHRSLGGDRDVGEVNIPVTELEAGGATRRFVSYQVRRPKGKPKGILHFSYEFSGGKTAAVSPPPCAPPAGYAAVYPPPPQPPIQTLYSQPYVAYGYGIQPKPGYEFTPPPSYA